MTDGLIESNQRGADEMMTTSFNSERIIMYQMFEIKYVSTGELSGVLIMSRSELIRVIQN